MAKGIVIKSFSNGIKVFLNEEDSFEEIVENVSCKFNESKSFFKGSKIAIYFEGRHLSDNEEKYLIRSIEEAGELTILYLISNDSAVGENYKKAIDAPCANTITSDLFGKLILGGIKRGERLETESGAVIMGDIEPGAILVTGGSVVVLGGIYGTVKVSPYENPEKYFVAANDFSCEKLVIGNALYMPHEKSKWVIKPKMQSKIAYIANERIVVENISCDTLKEVSACLMKEK